MEGQTKNERDMERLEGGGIDLVEILENFIRLFFQFWWIVLICIFMGVIVWCGYSYIGYEPMYECEATFTVGTGENSDGNYNFYYSSSTADQLSKTFPYILDSAYFRSVLLEKLEKDSLNGTITASAMESSNVVTMSVQSTNAKDATEILRAALDVYPEAARFVLGELSFYMIDNPELPQKPYNRPIFWRVLFEGALAGVAVGVLILGVLAFLRKTVKTPEEMRTLTSLKCLSALPEIRFKARKKKKINRISILDERLSEGYVESIRGLQLRLEREMERKNQKVILVTSTISGEGKSTLAVNLAEMFATKGKQVLLVDGDLRKQEDAELLNCKNSNGLLEFIQARGEVFPVLELKEKKIWLTGGHAIAQNPAAVLSHKNIGVFLEQMRQEMDYIIIDTPPCGNFQDAAILADYADAILYVVRYDMVPSQKILEGLSFLQGRKAGFLGYVLNICPQTQGHYGYGRYGYGRYGYGRYGYSKYGNSTYGNSTYKEEVSRD